MKQQRVGARRATEEVEEVEEVEEEEEEEEGKQETNKSKEVFFVVFLSDIFFWVSLG